MRGGGFTLGLHMSLDGPDDAFYNDLKDSRITSVCMTAKLTTL